MHEDNLPMLWLIAGFLTLVLVAMVAYDIRAKRRPATLHHLVVERPEGSTLWAWHCTCGAGNRGFDYRGNATGQALDHAMGRAADRG